jgi:5-methylcytosine-specific restriction enzyme subunit McrC
VSGPLLWEVLPRLSSDDGRLVVSASEHEELVVSPDLLLTEGKLDVYPDFFKYVDASFRGGELIVRANGYVGLIPLNDRVIIDIQPRITIANIDRMRLVARYESAFLQNYARYYSVGEEGNASILDHMARALIVTTGAVVEHGLHREYVQRSSDTVFPRGRIKISESHQRHWSRGNSHIVATDYFTQTADTAPNRCLKYALWLLGEYCRSTQQKAGIRALASQVNARYQLFDNASLDRNRGFLRDELVANPELLPQYRAYLKDALNIAVTIIRGLDVSLFNPDADVLMASMIVEMDVLFERYVLRVLQLGITSRNDHLKVMDGNIGPPDGGQKALFEDSEKPEANPDIVVKNNSPAESVEFPVLCDVKYKVRKPQRDDINQAIAYMASYKCPSFVMVYPRVGSEVGLQKLGTIDGRTLFAYPFDLRSPESEAEEEHFVDAIHSLIP